MKDLKLIVAALLLFAILAGIGYAVTPPPPPPPPVPQNLYIFDTNIEHLQTNATDQSACRQCHQTSGTNISGGYNNTVGGVPTRHHSLVSRPGVTNPLTNTQFGCQDCHPTLPGGGVLLNRVCTDCHNGSSYWANTVFGARVGNFSRPHHVNTSYTEVVGFGNPAAARLCKTCHGSSVNNYNDSHYIPSYDTDLFITPFASFKATSNVPNNVSGTLHPGNKTWGGCYSCHEAHPENPDVESLHDTHHISILGNNSANAAPFQKVATPFNLTGAPGGRACFVCHVVNLSSGSYYRIDIPDQNGSGIFIRAMELRNSSPAQNTVLEPGTTNITVNGSGCEKCHGVPTLHNIQFNYVQNGAQGLGHINNNTDCNGCHAGFVPQDDVGFGAFVPSVNDVSPAVIAPGIATTLTITGNNFVSGYSQDYTSVVTVDGVSYTPSSVTDTQIVVDIPAQTVGTHLLQVVKAGEQLSKLTTIVVAPNLQITSATVNKGTITITGTGFGTKPTTNVQYYVSVKDASGKQIISTAIIAWSDTQIKAKNSAAASGLEVTVLTANTGEVRRTIS